MMLFRSRLLQLLLVALLVSQQSLAYADAEMLKNILQQTRFLSATFEQKTVDIDNHLVQQSAGKLFIQRPDLFRWQYFSPYEQLIVGDGKQVWLYDIDLEQVTVSDQGEALANTPALLLSRPELLEQRFDVKLIESNADSYLFRLRPKVKDDYLQQLSIKLVGSEIRALEFTDGFERRTVIHFSDIKHKQSIIADLFSFVVPPGVDVIRR